MATQYTSLLGLALPVQGELSGTWGDTVNDSITSLLDTAVAGTTSLTTDADTTLTTTTGASNQARQAIIRWSPASGTVTRNITAPAQSKIYTVINASGGTQSIVFRGAGPTTGVTIVKGESAVVAWNGSDFIKISNTGGGGSFTNVTISGTTTLSALTASTALALNASKEVVSVTNTGSGNNVLATSPTLVTPALGTPSSATLTNATGLPISTGVSGLGTGVATFLATPSSANLAAAVTDETGSGALVFATSPTLVTPALGTPSSGVVTNLTGTASININGTVGATTPSTGAFTTLTASSTATLNTLASSGATLTGGTIDSMSIGATTASTGAFTTLSASSTVTFTGLSASQAVFTNASDQLVSNAITGTGNVVMSASPTLTGTITAAAITASGAITGNGNWTIGNADTDTITQNASYVNGTVLRSSKVATNTLNIAAYDVDGAAYTNLITLTASNTPTLALTSTGVGTIDNMSIGATTASTGAFTTLSASSTVSGTGFSTYLASPPAIGGTTANTGAFTNLSYTGTLTGGTGVVNLGSGQVIKDASGNVGIGITPTEKLHVSGNILVTGSVDCGTQFLGLATDTAAAPSFSFTSDTDTGMYRVNTNQLGLTTGGTVRLTVTTAQFTATLPWRGQNGTAAAPALSASGDTNTGFFFPAADNLGFSVAGAEQMRLTSTGLGIGNSSPTAKLDVTGTAAISGDVTLSGGTANGVAYLNGSKVLTTGSALWFDGTNFGVGTGGNALNHQSVVYKVGANAVYQQIANGSTGLGATNGIRLGVSNGGTGELYSPTALISYIDNAEQMRLTSTGLGIGTSSPLSKLDVFTAATSIAYVRTANQTMKLTADDAGNRVDIANAADSPISFTIGTTEQMRLTSTGLGIGTSSPAYKLQVASGATAATSYFSSTATPAYSATAYNGGNARISMIGGGASGATTGINFSQGGSFEAYFGGVQESGGAAAFVWQGYSGSAYAERMRLDSSGNLLVGTTSSAETTAGVKIRSYDASSANVMIGDALTTNDNVRYILYSTGASAYRFYVGMGGTIFATSTSISAISDVTLKENVRDLETGLTEVMALRPRRFDWKNGDAHDVAGFIAQEVEQVLPELVTDYLYNKDEQGNDIIKKSLKMGDILPTMVKAIQEQQAIITALTARVAALESI